MCRPLLFQSGETAHGVPLHDHQHPHDVFSELADDYWARVGTIATAYLYLAYPGEPALGPPDSCIAPASHRQFALQPLALLPVRG